MIKSNRTNFVLLLCIPILVLVEVIIALNIETRTFHSLSPANSDPKVAHFGTAVELRTSALNSEAYVGAPSDDNRNGSLYKCTFNGATSGNTNCFKETPFDKRGAIGITIDKDNNGGNIYVCGNRHVIDCPKSQLQKRMIGTCFKKSTTTANVELLKSPCTTTCPIGSLVADIVFVLDESGSVDAVEYQNSLDWMNQVISSFSSFINRGDVHVGVIGFSFDDSDTKVRIRLQKWQHSTLASQINSLANGRSLNGLTYIGYAINLAIQEFRNYGRPNTPKEMILLTDGQATAPANVGPAANNARANSIITVSVGVGSGVDEAQLLTIAGNSSRVFRASDYSNLASVVEGVKSTIQDIASVKLEGEVTNTTNKLAECQLGISSHITKKNNFYVGAVGSYDRAGAVAEYSAVGGEVQTTYSAILNETEYATMVSSENTTQVSDSYLGYSISSGNFFGGNIEYVASGAPRYRLKGMVAIYKADAVVHSSSKFLILHPSETSNLWQLGAYFGHSVCAVDINKDSLDDLLVSAPLFNDVTTGYDQGRVFVFMNDPNNVGMKNWTMTSYRPQVLSGSNANGARFGMSVAVVGDVDKNGYDDIAVGAPMEGGNGVESGAIYVYFISDQGIMETRKQKIIGRSVTSSLLRFGGFISTGRSSDNDVDKNGYSDLVISAPASDRIIVFRARPIVKVRTQITLNPPSIDLIKCFTSSMKACSNVTVCLTAFYTDEAPLTALAPLNVTLKLDSLLGNQPNKRIVFVDSVSSGKTVLYNVSSSRSCFTLQVQLNVDYFASVLSTGNFQIPLRLEVSYDYTNDYKNTIMSSMLDPWSTKTSTSDWKIQKSCSAINGTQCIHDLKVDTIFSIPPGENPLILGSNPGLLSINVTISNLGPDHSYFTRVNIIGNLDLNKVSGSCITVLQNESPDTTLVSYKASNSFIQGLMLSGKQCSFVLEYTLGSLTKRAEVQNILIQGAVYSNVNATNLSNDPKILNNIFKFQKKVLYTASIVHTGSSKPIAVFYNRTVVPSAFIHNLSNTILGICNNITHEHTIYNRGPNLVSKASLVFTWPRQTKEGLPLLYLYKFECIPQSICQCNTMNKVNEYGLAINNETSSANISINFNSNENLPDVTTCNDVKCDTITCHVKQFGKFSTVVVSSSFKVWIPSLEKPKLVSRFSSSLNFSYTESPIYNQAAVISTATTQVSAYSPPVPPNDQSQDNIGAIIGAIVGGIILLITITLIMWKAGFFESKYARMQKEAQEDNTNDNTEHSIVED